jgi:hypothetical protein
MHPGQEVRHRVRSSASGDRGTGRAGQTREEGTTVKLDDDEPQADVRAKQAALENAQIALQEAYRTLRQVENHAEFIPEQRYLP